METYRRFHEAVNTGDLEIISKAIEEFIHPQGRFHGAEHAGVSAMQAQKGVWAMLLRAFPDIQVRTEDVIAEGDKLVVRQTVTGTNTGEYRGRPPTGRQVSYGEIFIARFAGGQVVELWGVVDLHAQLTQLGLV
ncbi:ester cyclase [Nonomuraea sp. NBC_01738]|uniref:ester cyclase n=1 Tax=Nonomuraea sp. NBC_01738 TaxID=2976003 RepID=UPI002E0ED134|nr:ester cyclase [Nonomuraea sp. NBC_01738]